MTKQCRRCLKVKPADKFYRNRNNREGLSSWCQACQLKRRREQAPRDNAERSLHQMVDERGYRPKEPDIFHRFN